MGNKRKPVPIVPLVKPQGIKKQKLSQAPQDRRLLENKTQKETTKFQDESTVTKPVTKPVPAAPKSQSAPKPQPATKPQPIPKSNFPTAKSSSVNTETKAAIVESRKANAVDNSTKPKPAAQNVQTPAATGKPAAKASSAPALDPKALAAQLMQQRNEARARRDWATADALRDRIKALGLKVQDEKIAEGIKSKLVDVAAIKARNLENQEKREAEAAARRAAQAAADAENADDDDEDEGEEDDEDGEDESAEEEGEEEEEGGEEEDWEEDDDQVEEEEEDEEEDEAAIRAAMKGAAKAAAPEVLSTKKGAAAAGGVGAERTLALGVKVTDLVVGKGPFLEDRKTVAVHYTGRLTNGKVFDKSGGKPFTFRLGRGEVIKGWDIGVAGMRVGGKRVITCPPDAAYGKGGTSGIPPNSTLVFDVTAMKH